MDRPAPAVAKKWGSWKPRLDGVTLAKEPLRQSISTLGYALQQRRK